MQKFRKKQEVSTISKTDLSVDQRADQWMGKSHYQGPIEVNPRSK